MRIVIYETNDGEYVISSRGLWLPGVYADLKAARWAYQFPNTTLERLSNMWNPITTEHLRKAQSHGQRLRDLSEGQDPGTEGLGSPGI